MKVLMSWSGGLFDILGYPKRWLVVASTIVRAEVMFWQETLLKNLKSRWTGFIFEIVWCGSSAG